MKPDPLCFEKLFLAPYRSKARPRGPTRERDGEIGVVERPTPGSRRPGRLLKLVNTAASCLLPLCKTKRMPRAYLHSLRDVSPPFRDPGVRI
jgi:hypothetical protein